MTADILTKTAREADLERQLVAAETRAATLTALVAGLEARADEAARWRDLANDRLRRITAAFGHLDEFDTAIGNGKAGVLAINLRLTLGASKDGTVC